MLGAHVLILKIWSTRFPNDSKTAAYNTAFAWMALAAGFLGTCFSPLLRAPFIFFWLCWTGPAIGVALARSRQKPTASGVEDFGSRGAIFFILAIALYLLLFQMLTVAIVALWGLMIVVGAVGFFFANNFQADDAKWSAAKHRELCTNMRYSAFELFVRIPIEYFADFCSLVWSVLRPIAFPLGLLIIAALSHESAGFSDATFILALAVSGWKVGGWLSSYAKIHWPAMPVISEQGTLLATSTASQLYDLFEAFVPTILIGAFIAIAVWLRLDTVPAIAIGLFLSLFAYRIAETRR